MFEKSVLYGGERMQRVFSAKEEFVLWGLEAVGQIPVGENDTLVDKTELTVSKLDDETGRKFKVGTLSSAIAGYVTEAKPTDFPTVVYWTEEETSRGLNPAVVLKPVRKYEEG